MFALHRRRSLPVLRMFVLGLLVFGLLVKPVLAMACDIGDAQRTLAGEHPPAIQAPDAGTGDDCCPSQSCNECCAPTAALLPQIGVAMSSQASTSTLPTLSMQFEPTAYPVGFRPPIAM